MVGEPERHGRIVEQVADIYRWIDSEVAQAPDRAGRCNACGACCDLHAYDHCLFVTPPELIYLAARLGFESLRKMTTGRCPYQRGAQCAVREHRFAGCRIFCCIGSPDFQSDLSEATLRRLKTICEQSDLPYCYQDLGKALNAFTFDTYRSARTPCPADREG